MTSEQRTNRVRLIILLIGLPVILYAEACLIMTGHFENLSGNYGSRMLDIADNYHPDDRLVGEECEADRYQAAEQAALSVALDHGFNVLIMAREWNRDFLAEQPPCAAKEPRHE